MLTDLGRSDSMASEAFTVLYRCRLCLNDLILFLEGVSVKARLHPQGGQRSWIGLAQLARFCRSSRTSPKQVMASHSSIPYYVLQ